MSGSQQYLEGPGGIGQLWAELGVQDSWFLTSEVASGLGPERTESRGAHTCSCRWLVVIDFGLLPIGNRSGDDNPSKECPEQMGPCAQPGQASLACRLTVACGSAQVQSIGRGWYPCNTTLAVGKRPEAGRAQTGLSSDAVPVHFQFVEQAEGPMEEASER